MKKPEHTFIVVNIFGIVVFFIVAVMFFWHNISVSDNILGENVKTRGQYRVGFIPSWNFLDADIIPYEHFSEIVYFGLTVNADGTIIRENDDTVDLGWYRLYSEEFNTLLENAHSHGTRVSVAFKPKETKYISQIVRNEEAQKTFRKEILRVVNLRKLDGINIDFEFAHGGNPELSKQYFLFLADLFTSIKDEDPNLITSFDEYPNTFIHANKTALMETLKYSDYAFIMAYDFHAGRSYNAGPVAPLTGEPGEVNSIEGTVKVIAKRYNPHEFILGLPLYGYQWETQTAEFMSSVIPNTAITVAYDKLFSPLWGPTQWDELTNTAWTSYTDNGKTYQVYFDTKKSLQRKVDTAKAYDLAGVGFWSLDMAYESPELWEELSF